MKITARDCVCVLIAIALFICSYVASFIALFELGTIEGTKGNLGFVWGAAFLAFLFLHSSITVSVLYIRVRRFSYNLSLQKIISFPLKTAVAHLLLGYCISLILDIQKHIFIDLSSRDDQFAIVFILLWPIIATLFFLKYIAFDFDRGSYISLIVSYRLLNPEFWKSLISTAYDSWSCYFDQDKCKKIIEIIGL